MAGWDILQQPFQYHQPVAPVVPEPDNTAAKIISAGTDTAVSGFLRAAIARRQADLEEQQQVQQAALTMRAQDIAKENNAMDYDVALKNAESLENYRTSGGGAGSAAQRATDNFNRALLDRQIAADRAESIAKWDEIGKKAYHEMGLHDEEKWNTSPVQQLENYQSWMGKYGSAVEGNLVKVKEQLQRRAELVQIPIREGSTYEDGYTAADGTYVAPRWVGGEEKPVPLLQFVERYRYNPQEREPLRRAVEAAGGNTRIIDRLDKSRGPAGTIIHKREFVPRVQGILQGAERANLQRGENEIPSELMTKPPKTVTPYGGSGNIEDQSNTEMTIPEPDLPPLAPGSSIESPSGPTTFNFTPTRTDTVLSQARQALAFNPAARDEIARRLAAMQINPNLLGA